jgi:hypothetical protein
VRDTSCTIACNRLNREATQGMDARELNASIHSSLLPTSCKIYASAGAGFDWVDTKTMAERGEFFSL